MKSGSVQLTGNVSGLIGRGLTLEMNGADIAVETSLFTSAISARNGDLYELKVSAQPQGPGQECALISPATGIITNGILEVKLLCNTGSYTVGGSISGLAGSGLQLQLNNNEIISPANNNFTFSTQITDGHAYNVQVKVQPTSPVQICTPEFNVGVLTGSNITNVHILCSTVPYSVGGYVNGLEALESVTLQINGGQSLTRSSDGFFLFPVPLADLTHYSVTISSQPAGKTCSIRDGSGIVNGRGSYAAYVQCSTDSYFLSGTLNGLTGGYVSLVSSTGEYLPVVANGVFTFNTKIASGGSYAVQVFRNPTTPAQVCTVSNGNGNNMSADAGDISVTCTSNGFTVGGSIAGLTASGLVLRLNGIYDRAVDIASSAFTFPSPLVSGSPFIVTIAAQPQNLKCSVLSGSGTVTDTNITNVAVTCQPGYSVGGTVTGFAGTSLVLRNSVNNISSDYVISGNSFTFPELLASGDTYSVQVLNHPESPFQTCGISNSSGTVASLNISNINVNCSNVTVQFQSASGSAIEADEIIEIPITITPPSARPLNLNLALAAGTAAAGVDYNFLTPTIHVPTGATTVYAQLQIFNDNEYESDETIIINLTGIDKAALGAQLNYTHVITNDDGVAAAKVVVTNAGNNFTAGNTTSITVQVQDTLNNLATTDNSTQITFSPTGSGRINSVTTGTGDGSYGVAGGAETVTVSSGIATVVIANTVAQSFQIAIINNAGLTNPANISLTSNSGAATQIVITSPAADTSAGQSTNLTVQVQDVYGNLVTNATTAITFDPTASGTITGVTTGTGDGSYGVPGGPETVLVSGGIATITLVNNTAQTYEIFITNNGGLTNPPNDSVTVTPASASQVVLTSPGTDFLTGAQTSITVQVRDSFGNLRTSDNSTQITFTPTGSGTISGVTTGTGDGSYGVIGGAETVTVSGGVATVTITNNIAETFSISFTNNAGLSNPSPDSITTSAGASKIAITQAGVSFIVGNSTTLTLQVQTSADTLVNTDNNTQVTFTPTNSGRITGVTTGTGDGSYGVVAGAETVTVSGGVVSITLSNSEVETFQVAITNNAGLTNPPNDNITVNGATGAVITKAEYFDVNHNGKLDHVKITFDKNVDETTISGDITTQFLIAGYSGVALVSGACIDESYPTNGNCTDEGEVNDTTDNNIIWLSFTEGNGYDTGATPDLTGVDVSLRTATALGGCFIHTSGGDCNTQSAADFGTLAVAEADKAPPVLVAAWSDPVIDAWQLRIQFSEAVDLTAGVGVCSGTVTNSAFMYNNLSGSGASALRTDFADNNPCDSTGGSYYVIPRVNARFTMSDLKTDTLALVSTFYDTVGLSTIATTKTIGYDPNLELYYPVDAAAPVNDSDNTTVHDVTANNRHGAITGAVRVRDMNENNYSALKFDGDDYITVTGYKGVIGTTNRTISAWVWSDHGHYNGTDHNRCSIVLWGGGPFYGMALNHTSAIGQLGGLTQLAGGSLTNTSTTPVVSGGWMHVAITWANDGTPNGADAVLYVNGVAQSVTSAGGSMNTGSSMDVVFGRGAILTDALFRGKMDEMRIYSRALGAAEIKKLATKVPGGAYCLVSYGFQYR